MEGDFNLADRYRIVRKHLDRLGYRQALSLDSLQLIERLLADLIQTTESLKYFKTVAQDNIEACSQLQLAAEPYKCDNARLVQECNDLHSTLIKIDEDHQKEIRELKKHVRKLESDNSDLQLASSRNLKRIRELEIESAGKRSKILELQGKYPLTKQPSKGSILKSDPSLRVAGSSVTSNATKIDRHVSNPVGMTDHRMNCLNREVTKLKEELSAQNENVHTLKSQLANKEKEILRLKRMLEGGRPLTAVTKDYLCKKTEKSCYGDVSQIELLERAKHDLELQLKEATSKQHEAMSRALKLAERNEELEKELRDIDHIALAVEADCNSAVQENNRRVSRLQEKVEDLMTQVHVLENELTTERREAHELRADLEGCRLEKRNLQRVLESTLDEKKQMTDRINQLTIIEKDLNDEIDRLSKNCAKQKDEIVRLECCNDALKNQVHAGGGDDRQKNKENGEKSDKNKGKKVLKKKSGIANSKTTCDSGKKPSPYLDSWSKGRSPSPAAKRASSLHRENEVSKDAPNHSPHEEGFPEKQNLEYEKDSVIGSLKKTLERLQSERDYYRNEYNKLRNEFNPVSEGSNAEFWTQNCDLKRQLNERNQAIADLQRENKELSREKFNLESRLETSRSQQRSCHVCSLARSVGSCSCPPPSSPCGTNVAASKAMLERLERERDTARADVDRVIEERDALRERLKMAVDAHMGEQRRLREDLSQTEARLKQLETERQDLMMAQGTRRATISGLEDQLEDLRQELRRTKEELTTQRTQYFQLRALQEQTDQALGDVQGQLGHSETELNKMIDHNRHVEQQRKQLDNQVKESKQECNLLRSKLAQLDQQKDQLLINLDEKTERIVGLEREVRFKEEEAHGLEQQLLDFERKYQICVDQSAEQERQHRTMEVELNNLQREIASVTMERDNAIRENSRVQDDLAAMTCEYRNLQRESQDVKRQLQTYVAEVRRAEETLNRTENQRSKMLEDFRCLSLEATVLENNNQSLESEAAEARSALQSAQDRLRDLERQIVDRDCLIGGYEAQISELTQHVASMETQLEQQMDQRRRTEDDLKAVRDLCVQLDHQKESLEQELCEKEAVRAQCEAQLKRLRTDQEMAQDQRDRDSAAVDRLEELLCQARQESVGNQAANQELQSEINRLKQKMCELQNKLHAETAELRRYQNQAAEYSKQISELRRQMTNERFDRARKEEENRRKADWLKIPYTAVPCCPRPQNQSTSNLPTSNATSTNAGPSPGVPASLRSDRSSNSHACRTTRGACGNRSTKLDLKTRVQMTNRSNTFPANRRTCRNSCGRVAINKKVSDSKLSAIEDIDCIEMILSELMNVVEQRDQVVQVSINAGNESLRNRIPCGPRSRDKNVQIGASCNKTTQMNNGVQCGDDTSDSRRPATMRSTFTSTTDLIDNIGTLFWPLHSTKLPNGASDRTFTGDRGRKRTRRSMNPGQTIEQGRETGIKSTRTQIDDRTCDNACPEFSTPGPFYKSSNLMEIPRGETEEISDYTLPSVISNNPTVPKISITNTNSVRRDPSPRNPCSVPESSGCYPEPGIDEEESTPGKYQDVEGACCTSASIGAGNEDNSGTCGSKKVKFRRSRRRGTNFDGSTTTSGYWSNETDFSKLRCGPNVRPRSKSSSSSRKLRNERPRSASNSHGESRLPRNCESSSDDDSSIEEDFNYALLRIDTMLENQFEAAISEPEPNDVIRATDLTRPEFLQMLTEIKERTRSLEQQLSVMNDALKKKQASRKRVEDSIKRESSTMRSDDEQFACCSRKYCDEGPEPGMSNIRDSVPDQSSLPDSSGCSNTKKVQQNEVSLSGNDCCGENTSGQSNEPSTPVGAEVEDEEIILIREYVVRSHASNRSTPPMLRKEQGPVSSSPHDSISVGSRDPAKTHWFDVSGVTLNSISLKKSDPACKVDAICSPRRCSSESDVSLIRGPLNETEADSSCANKSDEPNSTAKSDSMEPVTNQPISESANDSTKGDEKVPSTEHEPSMVSASTSYNSENTRLRTPPMLENQQRQKTTTPFPLQSKKRRHHSLPSAIPVPQKSRPTETPKNTRERSNTVADRPGGKIMPRVQHKLNAKKSTATTRGSPRTSVHARRSSDHPPEQTSASTSNHSSKSKETPASLTEPVPSTSQGQAETQHVTYVVHTHQRSPFLLGTSSDLESKNGQLNSTDSYSPEIDWHVLLNDANETPNRNDDQIDSHSVLDVLQRLIELGPIFDPIVQQYRSNTSLDHSSLPRDQSNIRPIDRSNVNNSERDDSKCTIRVTVSLEKTSSDENV